MLSIRPSLMCSPNFMKIGWKTMQGCKKFFFRSEHKISCWKIAPAISQNSLLFGGFWPISIVTWLELVFLKKSETDLTEFAYKWLHLFRKFMPTLKNRSGWLKFAPSNARVLADFLHPWPYCIPVIFTDFLYFRAPL